MRAAIRYPSTRPGAMRGAVLVPAVGLIALLAACASTPREAQAPLPGEESCFWKSSIYSWTVLDPKTLLVQAPGPKETYLIKLFAPIPDLSFHEALGFEGDEPDRAQFCRSNGYVVAPGPIPQREPVVAVRALSPPEADRLLAAHSQARTHRESTREAATGSPAGRAAPPADGSTLPPATDPPVPAPEPR